jgi:multiple sugar transport system substrate-binding protein
MFKAAGITPPSDSAVNPWTWDQYVAAAKKLTKDNRGRTPTDAGFDYNNLVQYGTVMPTSWIYVLPLLNSANSGFATPDGRNLLISKTDGVNAIQKIANLALVDKVAPTVAMSQSTAFSSLSALLMNDQLGMFIGGTFQFPDFQNEKFDVGIAQIPSFSGKGSNISLPGAHVIKKGASQEAFELAAFLADYNNWVKVSKKYNIGINQLPSTRSTYDDPVLNKAWIEQFDAAMAKVAGDALANSVRPSESINLKNFSEIVDQTIAPVLDRVWLGSISAKDGLEPLEKTLAGKLVGAW